MSFSVLTPETLFTRICGKKVQSHVEKRKRSCVVSFLSCRGFDKSMTGKIYIFVFPERAFYHHISAFLPNKHVWTWTAEVFALRFFLAFWSFSQSSSQRQHPAKTVTLRNPTLQANESWKQRQLKRWFFLKNQPLFITAKQWLKFTPFCNCRLKTFLKNIFSSHGRWRYNHFCPFFLRNDSPAYFDLFQLKGFPFISPIKRRKYLNHRQYHMCERLVY